MRKSTLINHLKSLDEDELREELTILFNRFKVVKEYYKMELGAEKDRQIIFSKAKKDIKAKYRTKSLYRPKRPRISKINRILSDIDKVSIFKEEMADLYLYNCECALEFILHYQYHSEPLHNTVVGSFKRACSMIAQSSTISEFGERCQQVIDKSFDAYEHLGYRVQEAYYNVIEN